MDLVSVCIPYYSRQQQPRLTKQWSIWVVITVPASRSDTMRHMTWAVGSEPTASCHEFAVPVAHFFVRVGLNPMPKTVVCIPYTSHQYYSRQQPWQQPRLTKQSLSSWYIYICIYVYIYRLYTYIYTYTLYGSNEEGGLGPPNTQNSAKERGI